MYTHIFVASRFPTDFGCMCVVLVRSIVHCLLFGLIFLLWTGALFVFEKGAACVHVRLRGWYLNIVPRPLGALLPNRRHVATREPVAAGALRKCHVFHT